MKNIVIITGASGNLGKATVEYFLRQQATVLATVSPGKSLGYQVEGALETFEVDLTDEIKVQTFVKDAAANFGKIDAALMLVGGFAAGNIDNTTGDSLKKMVSLNFETSYFVARPVFQQMKTQPQGGRLVFIGSRPALRAEEGKNTLAYGLSKSLIFKLAEYLNAEGASHQVVSHVLVPGTIDTPANRAALPQEKFSDWVSPEEIAEALWYLTSSKGRSLRETVLKMYANS